MMRTRGPLVALAVLLALVLGLPSAAAPPGGPFPEADRVFDGPNPAAAEPLYERLAAQARAEGNAADLARALEGLAAVYLTTGRDDRFRTTMTEVVTLRRSLPSPAVAPAGPNLVLEGGFERGLVPPWGSGHYETGDFNFGIWWNSQGCRSFAKIDSAEAHSGQSSLRITDFSPQKAHVFGTTAQRIRPVTPNTLYEISMWAKGRGVTRGSVRVAMDAGWRLCPLSLPEGTYDWTFCKARFNSGDLDQVDLRFLVVDVGTVWVDDVSLRRLDPGEVPEDPVLEADLQYRRGAVVKALDLYRDLEGRWASEPDRLRHLYPRIIDALATLGRYGEAMEYYRRLPSPPRYEAVLAMGDMFVNLGQPEKARGYFLSAYQRAEGDQAMQAIAADRVAMACLRLGQVDDAMAYEGVSLRIMTHINDPHGRAVAQCHLGQILARVGKGAAARDHFEAALPLARRTGDRKLEADVLTQRAILGGAAGSVTEACRDLARAIELRREVCDRYGLVYSLFHYGRLLRQAGDRAGARAALEEAVETLETVKDAAGSIDRAGETLVESNAQLYEELIRLNLEEKRTEEAHQVLARSRSESLRRLFAGQATRLGPQQEQLLERARTLQGEREALERRVQQELSRPEAEQDPAAVAEARRAQEERLRDYRQFLRDLFQTHPELAGLVAVHPKQLKLKQKSLPADGAIVEYLCGEQQLYLFLVTPRTLEVRITDLGREELTRRIAALRRRISLGADHPERDPQLIDEAHRLYRDLLGPIAADLQGTRTLAILPNGPLHYLPFQVLVPDPTRDEFLVDRMACINLCEESFLAPSGSEASPSRLLLVGNPDGTLARAEEEVRQILPLFPGSQLYVGGSARKEEILAAAPGYQGLHIASHGILDSRDAAESYIVLAPDPADPLSGRLTLREIWGLDLEGLQLVTLSACRTALGEENPGDDLVSLENAFLFAGATSVVASLWAVEDTATARLMSHFYGNLKTEGRARALQQAQAALRREYPHPFFWAPFILVGPAESTAAPAP